MKHGKLFAKIVYFLFTFTIGIVLALFLPYIFGSDYGEILKSMESSLKKGNYADAMSLVGGYFDGKEIYQRDFEGGGGIVMFSAVTLADAEGDEEAGRKVHAAYAGFVYGAESYAVTAAADNKTRLVVTDGAGEEHTVELLNTDSDGDGKKDTINTLRSNKFFYFDLPGDGFPSLRKLTFYDKDGQVYQEISSLELDYQEQFFTDVNEFVEEYNRDYKSEKLDGLHDAFLAKSESYRISSTGVVKNSKADTKAAIVVVVYFVCVYIVADFLLGYHFIIRLFRWFLFKVCKIKPKQKKPPKHSEVFGNDYYCQVTFELDVTEAENFDGGVQIRYTGDKGEEISFILLKQEGYKATQRIKAGTYVNLWIDLDKTKYITRDLPETLWVEGYRKTFTVKILRREGGEGKGAEREETPEENEDAADSGEPKT